MKKLLQQLSIFSLGVIAILGFTLNSNQESTLQLPVGSVIYSILPPDIMNSRFPNEYIPLKGDPIALDSDLYKMLDAENRLDLFMNRNGSFYLPDARAMFIRGMNLERSDEYKDPNGDSRTAGSPQRDLFEKHSHTLTRPVFGHVNEGFGRCEDMDPGGWGCYQKVTTDEKGGIETRPNNISLYTYIKVN